MFALLKTFKTVFLML